MRMTRKLAVGSALGALTLISVASSATAGEWQALQGVAAMPMTSAQMQAVQGKMIVIDHTLKVTAEEIGPALEPITIGGNTAYFFATNGGSLDVGKAFYIIVK